MRRYWIDGVSELQPEIEITKEEYHHIVDVCRQGVGSQFEVLTTTGYALLVEMTAVLRKSAVARVMSLRKIEEIKKPYIHLALSVPKLATFESVLEKSVELGVYKIWPFVSDYSFFKSKKNIMTDKAMRFQKIIKGATQQSARSSLMDLASVEDLETLIEVYQRTPHSQALFAYEGEGGRSLKSVLATMESTVEHIWLFVGSEGGFSLQEVEMLKKINLFPVSLGHQVLRVETACVTLLGVIKYELNLF